MGCILITHTLKEKAGKYMTDGVYGPLCYLVVKKEINVMYVIAKSDSVFNYMEFRGEFCGGVGRRGLLSRMHRGCSSPKVMSGICTISLKNKQNLILD